APAGRRVLEVDEVVRGLDGELADMAVGPSGAIRQALHPAILVAVEDLVAGLARDLELPAQHRHLLPIQTPSYEAKPFVHLVTLLPRHLRTLRKCRKVSPMSPE